MSDRKIDAMHRIYGKDPWGRKCDKCPHLFRRVRSRAYYKCEVYGSSASEATDWRVGYWACAMIDKDLEKGHVPVFERLKHSPATLPKIPGQISMEDLIQPRKDD